MIQIALLLFLSIAHAQNFEFTAAASSASQLELRPDLPIQFNAKDLSDPEDWKRKYFDLVVVIDKAPKVQKAKIYRDGKLVRTTKVSTGREKVELVDDPKNTHNATHDTVSETYTGYYTPTLLDIDHISQTYEDVEMPYAVFFDEAEGIATHQAPPGTEKQLGHRASGGCVRMTEKSARDIFWFTRFSGGPLLNSELSTTKFATESQEWIKAGYKTYDQVPEIPKFDISGNLEKTASGEPIMQPGYKALFIVLNSALKP